MRKHNVIGLLAFLGWTVIAAPGCNDGGGSSDAFEVGPEGKVIQVTHATDPLFGLLIEVPPQALKRKARFKLATASVHPPIPGPERSGQMIVSIECSEATLDIPATIHLPYPDAPDEAYLVPIECEDEADPGWCQLYPYEVRRAEDRIVFETNRFGTFTCCRYPRLEPGRRTFHIENEAPFESPEARASATRAIEAALVAGPWKDLMACAGFTLERTDVEADIAIEWGNLADTCFILALAVPPDLEFPLPEGPVGSPTWRVILNTKLVACGLGTSVPPSGGARFDLCSIMVHEMSHVLGWPPCPDRQPAAPGAATDGVLEPWETLPELQPPDREFFREIHPEAADCE
jgi:hypothetical protein